MLEWESVNGKAVKQRTVCQEPDMAKSGTLPEFCYRQELKSTDANQDTECNSNDPGKNENENLDYDTDDTLEDCLDNFDEEVEISKEGTFLVGKTSKFGIAVKFNRKFL